MERGADRSGRVLARPVGDFPAWAFELACPGCGAWRDVPAAELIRHYGGRHLVREVVERFSCRSCRTVPSPVVFRGSGERIVLRGAGRRAPSAAGQADLLDRAG